MNRVTFTTLKKQRIELRERILLDATIETLGDIPYHELRVSDISERVGVPIRTIYNYFSSKETMVTKAFIRMLDLFYQRLDMDKLIKDPHPLVSLAKILVDFFLENRASFQTSVFVNAFSVNPETHNNEFSSGIFSFFDKNIDFFRGLGCNSKTDSFVYGFYTSVVGVVCIRKNEAVFLEKDENLRDLLYESASFVAEIFERQLPLFKE